MHHNIQKIVLRYLICPVEHWTRFLGQRGRKFCYVIGLLGLIFMQFANSSGLLNVRHLFLLIPACVFFGLMILGGMTHEMKPVSFRWSLMLPWIGVGTFMTITGVLVSSKYLADAVLWLVVFPIFFLVWCNRPFQTLANMTMVVVLVSFVVFLLLDICFFPAQTQEYKSLFLNQNGAAAYCLGVFVCSLSWLFSQKKVNWKYVVGILSTSISAIMIIYSSSRTSMAAMSVGLIFGTVFQLLTHRDQIAKIMLFYLLPIIVVVALLLSSLANIMYCGYRLMGAVIPDAQQVVAEFITIRDIAVERGGELKDEIIIVREELTEKEKEILEEYGEENEGTQGILNRIYGQFSTNDKDKFAYLNGRLQLWSAYLRNTKLIGNSKSEAIYYADGEEVELAAHNTLIEVGYEYGAPAGVFLLILNLASGVWAIYYAIKQKEKAGAVIPLIMIVSYGTLSLAEVIISPVTRLMALIYFIAVVPLLNKEPVEDVV